MEAMDDILSALRSKSGIDFSSYRAPTVQRRIRNRMMSLRIRDLASYGGLLEQSDTEVQHLIERLTIKVSRFYRNPVVFETLRHAILPELGRAARPLRVWSAGCGRGEEPYTLAMLLEAAGLEGSIVATDVDAFALEAARDGVYPVDAASELPPDLRERFMRCATHAGAARLAVAPSVKSRVVFQHADLGAAGDAGPGECDLVCCRNLLIYWNEPMQRRMLRSLVASLRIGGYLCIGEAEWPDADSARCLEPLGARLRMFRKIAGDERP